MRNAFDIGHLFGTRTLAAHRDFHIGHQFPAIRSRLTGLQCPEVNEHPGPAAIRRDETKPAVVVPLGDAALVAQFFQSK